MFWQSLAVGSAGLSLYGGLRSRKVAKKQRRAARRLADYQIKVNRVAEGERARQMNRRFERLTGTVRANRAKSGVTSQGTPSLVMQENAELAAIDMAFAAWHAGENEKLIRMRARAGGRAASTKADAATLNSIGTAADILYNAFGR